jgi:hypothetical protein
MAQAYTGIFISVMPGARVNRMPTMSSMAPAIAEISMKPMPSSQKSAFRPGEYSLAGQRRVHEPAAVGARPKKIVQKKARPPIA